MSTKHWYIYSLDEDVKIKALRAGEVDSDAYETTAIEQWCAQKGIQVHVLGDQYHYKRHGVTSKPYIVYAMGDMSLLDRPLLGIVWPRRVSAYIRTVMDDACALLAEYDLVTISWGADGVDTICHELSISRGVPTIMVLWGGIAHYLWSKNRALIERVVEAWGLVLSEFRLKMKPTPRSFPQRNRIVAWLADVVFVPGAGAKSWSLITVDMALRTSTPVYTVPASIYETSSQWSNEYLSEWKIQALTSVETLFDTHFMLRSAGGTHSIGGASNSSSADPSSLFDISEQQKQIMWYIREQWASTVDVLVSGLSLPPHELLWEMMELEMWGYIYESDVGVRSTK